MKQTKDEMKTLRRKSSEEKLRGEIAKIKISVDGLQTMKNIAKGNFISKINYSNRLILIHNAESEV